MIKDRKHGEVIAWVRRGSGAKRALALLTLAGARAPARKTS